jgi:NAD(P)-dependent dehydrogenase (short-subunit alcohol dehydrogenase family)
MIDNTRTAVVFGAYGAIGEAVARRLAADGVRLHLVGRDPARLAELAVALGARAHVADATSETAVEAVMRAIVDADGRLDLSFCAVGPRPDAHGYGRPVEALALEHLLGTLALVTGAQYAVARAAARHMMAQRRGAIVTLSASLSGQFVPLMAGITAACAAVEGLTRSLAAELGPHGVRVNCVRAGGMPSTRTIRETVAAIERTTGAPFGAGSSTLLGQPLEPSEVASAVAWLGSDAGSGVVGQVVNVCRGSVVSR